MITKKKYEDYLKEMRELIVLRPDEESEVGQRMVLLALAITAFENFEKQKMEATQERRRVF